MCVRTLASKRFGATPALHVSPAVSLDTPSLSSSATLGITVSRINDDLSLCKIIRKATERKIN